MEPLYSSLTGLRLRSGPQCDPNPWVGHGFEVALSQLRSVGNDVVSVVGLSVFTPRRDNGEPP